jgi:hypothetical protein
MPMTEIQNSKTSGFTNNYHLGFKNVSKIEYSNLDIIWNLRFVFWNLAQFGTHMGHFPGVR